VNLRKASELYADECEKKNEGLEGEELAQAKLRQGRVMNRLLAQEHSERGEREREHSTDVPNPRWGAVRRNRELLTAPDLDNYPVRAEFENAWRLLEHEYMAIDRNDLENTAAEPFAAIMYFLDLGFYPPPELMLWLLDAWDEFLYRGKTMEEAFLGPAKQKAGGYSARNQRKLALMRHAFEFARLVGEDKSKKRISEKKYNAAQKIVDKYQLNITPANLIRKLGKEPMAKAAKSLAKVQMQQFWKEMGFKPKR
jgi:hypothetical protein